MSDELSLVDGNVPEDGKDKEEKELFGDEKRGELIKKNIHVIIILFMYFLAFSFACMVFVRSWDFVVADKYHWLTEREDHDLERIIFSGIIVSFATKYFKKFNIIDG